MLEIRKTRRGIGVVRGGTRHCLECFSLCENALLVTDGNALVWVAWKVDYARELEVFLLDVFLCVSLANIFLIIVVEVIEVNHTVLTTGSESHIVSVPINAHNASDMASKLHSIKAVTREEVVDVDVLLVRDTGKEMSSVRESNLVAALNL